MKFNLKNEWGDHKTYSYDTDAYKFLEYFEKLYQKDMIMKLLRIALFYMEVVVMIQMLTNCFLSQILMGD